MTIVKDSFWRNRLVILFQLRLIHSKRKLWMLIFFFSKHSHFKIPDECTPIFAKFQLFGMRGQYIWKVNKTMFADNIWEIEVQLKPFHYYVTFEHIAILRKQFFSRWNGVCSYFIRIANWFPYFVCIAFWGMWSMQHTNKYTTYRNTFCMTMKYINIYFWKLLSGVQFGIGLKGVCISTITQWNIMERHKLLSINRYNRMQ